MAIAFFFFEVSFFFRGLFCLEENFLSLVLSRKSLELVLWKSLFLSYWDIENHNYQLWFFGFPFFKKGCLVYKKTLSLLWAFMKNLMVLIFKIGWDYWYTYLPKFYICSTLSSYWILIGCRLVFFFFYLLCGFPSKNWVYLFSLIL